MRSLILSPDNHPSEVVTAVYLQWIAYNSDRHVRAFMPFYGVILPSGFGIGLKIEGFEVQVPTHIYVEVSGKLPIQYFLCLLR